MAEAILSGQPFEPSDNEYDWLGPGIHFWQSNPLRALQFAEEKRLREKGDWPTAVIGAVISTRLCLDLSTQAGVNCVREAYADFKRTAELSGWLLPTNSGGPDLLLRKLDCAVIRLVHDTRRSAGAPPIDTVSGIFIEGQPLYPNSGFYEKTHIQLCVCNPACIKGVFRVSDSEIV